MTYDQIGRAGRPTSHSCYFHSSETSPMPTALSLGQVASLNRDSIRASLNVLQ